MIDPTWALQTPTIEIFPRGLSNAMVQGAYKGETRSLIENGLDAQVHPQPFSAATHLHNLAGLVLNRFGFPGWTVPRAIRMFNTGIVAAEYGLSEQAIRDLFLSRSLASETDLAQILTPAAMRGITNAMISNVSKQLGGYDPNDHMHIQLHPLYSAKLLRGRDLQSGRPLFPGSTNEDIGGVMYSHWDELRLSQGANYPNDLNVSNVSWARHMPTANQPTPTSGVQDQSKNQVAGTAAHDANIAIIDVTDWCAHYLHSNVAASTVRRFNMQIHPNIAMQIALAGVNDSPNATPNTKPYINSLGNKIIRLERTGISMFNQETRARFLAILLAANGGAQVDQTLLTQLADTQLGQTQSLGKIRAGTSPDELMTRSLDSSKRTPPQTN